MASAECVVYVGIESLHQPVDELGSLGLTRVEPEVLLELHFWGELGENPAERLYRECRIAIPLGLRGACKP